MSYEFGTQNDVFGFRMPDVQEFYIAPPETGIKNFSLRHPQR